MSTGWEDRTLTIEEVMQRSVPWWLWMAAAAFVPHFALHGIGFPHSLGLFLARLFLLIVAYAISAIIHELLHVVGMLLFGRVPLRSIRFGHRISEGVLYVHSREPMSARAYRGVLLLPGIVTGVVPTVIGIYVGSMWITVYGWMMMASAVGDLAVFRLMRDLAPDVRVQDHPSEVGLLVQHAETGVSSADD